MSQEYKALLFNPTGERKAEYRRLVRELAIVEKDKEIMLLSFKKQAHDLELCKQHILEDLKEIEDESKRKQTYFG